MKMPAFKLTTALYVASKLHPKWKSWIEENKQGVSVKILHAEHAREQIDSLKKVQKWLDVNLNVSSALEADVEKTLRFLVHLFFVSTSRNPIRRVLISYFQNLPTNLKNEIVGQEIRSELLCMCPTNTVHDNTESKDSDTIQDNTERKDSDTVGDNTENKDSDKSSLMYQLTNNLEVRHNVDTIGALIENFVLGEECVAAVCIDVLLYLGTLQKQFLHTYCSALSPVQKNETMHHCMETAKLANRICQRSSVAMETKLKQSDLVSLYMKVVNSFVQSDIRIIINDEFLLDCKTTSAMNLCQMLKFSDMGDHLLSVLCETVFKPCRVASEFQPLNEFPDWLSNLGLDRLRKDDLTSSAYLCTSYGILTMVSMETLLHVKHGNCFLLDVLLPEFLDLCQQVTDVGSKLLAAKSLLSLTQRIRTYVTKTDRDTMDKVLVRRLTGDSSDMKLVLDFIWTSWEDAVEAVRFTVKDIFENLVGIHQRVTESGCDDPFLGQLTVSILNEVNWSCKGKYGTLSVLVRHIGSARMLLLNPGIADQILQQLEEQTLSCYVRDLYDELCNCHLKELKIGNQLQDETDGNQGIDWSLWFNTWVEPVIRMLCQSTPTQKKHLIEYVLPKLLKTDDRTLYYMIQTLSGRLQTESHADEEQVYKGDQLGALIMCVRRARAMGLLKGRANKKGIEDIGGAGNNIGKEVLFGVLDVNLLQYALGIRNEQIRLDAFALLCESQTTTGLISDTEMRLIQTFIPQNMANQNPSFRQLMLSYLKKFLCRLRESMQVLLRQLKREPASQDHITEYQVFLKWLLRYMFESIYPGSNFPRRTMALTSLSLLMDTFSGHSERFKFYNEVQQGDMGTLLHCLTDTFEDNKSEASRILIACFQQSIPSLHLSLEEGKEYFNLALTLAMSSRPQDGMTAAYLLRVLIHLPNIQTLLKTKLKSQIEGSSQMTKSGDVTQTASRMHEFPSISMLLEIPEKSANWRKFLLLWILLGCLEDQFMVARDNLLVAAANKPMYPTMLCIRYCLFDVQFREIDVTYYPLWTDMLSILISLCLKISGIVSPVVHNCSPEGNIPEETLTELSRQTEMQAVTESEQTVMLMPEYLTVCCWRSVKEISLILGQLTADLPPLDISLNLSAGFLSYDQILSIGEYFTTQLLESKHRGAFELAYAGFVKVTEMLWRSNVPELHGLPKTWLTEVMEDVMSDDPTSRLCATRRSAGVPFYIQAIVSTEPSSTGRVCFKETMTTLIELAYSQPSKDMCNPKVHALNILRMLYKDSRLKDDVTPYLADGVKVAILGFKSHLWAVRNAATLLMAAMMNRVFGVKRSKDESSLSRKNCQTGKTFFFKYPMLYQFLLNELSEATENIGTQLHPGLYPILMVLGRLFPSTMEGTDTTLNLAAFIPLVIRCCSSPVLKTRMMAAKALQPLVEKDHVICVFSDLLTLLPSSQGDGIGQNQIHGVLLQLKFLLNTVSILPTALLDSLKQVFLPNWLTKMNYLITRMNPCLLTRTCALEISADVLDKFGRDVTILTQLKESLHTELLDMETGELYPAHTPCLSEFMCTVCELYIQCACTHTTEGVKVGHHYGNKEIAGNLAKRIGNGSQLSSEATTSGTGLDNGAGLKDETNIPKDLDKNSLDDMTYFEETCLTFLRSKSYEVRRSFLRKVSELISRGITTEKEEDYKSVGDTVSDASPFPRRSDGGQSTRGFLVCLSQSDTFYRSLLELCQTETHTECLAELLRLLQVYIYRDNGQTENLSVLCSLHRLQSEVIETWLDRLVSQTLSEEVLSACIEYVGSSIPTLCRNGRRLGGVQTEKATPLSLLEKFISIARDVCGAPETAVSIQLACARAMVTVCRCDIVSSALNGAVSQTDVSSSKEMCGDKRMGQSVFIESVFPGSDKMIKKLKCSGDVPGRTGEMPVGGGAKVEGGPRGEATMGGGLRGGEKNGSTEEMHVGGGAKMGGGPRAGHIDEGIARGGAIISETCVQNVYKVVFDLLQVDDLDVKDEITDVMLVVSDTWTKGSPHSYICTSLLMEHWLRHSPDRCLVTSSLLQLIMDNRAPEQKQDERLFDRGEMNTYRDEIDFIQVNDKTVSMATKQSCDESLCDTLLPVIITNTQSLVAEWTSHDAFMDCSNHEEWVMKVYRNLLMLKYGLCLSQETDDHVRIADMWKTFKSSIDTHKLPPFIVKIFSEVGLV